MINPSTGHLEIVDFEKSKIRIDEYEQSALDGAFYNYVGLVNQLNRRFGVRDEAGRFLDINNFDDAYYQLDQMQKKLKRD